MPKYKIGDKLQWWNDATVICEILAVSDEKDSYTQYWHYFCKVTSADGIEYVSYAEHNMEDYYRKIS